MAAGALIRNSSGELLIVKPSYKETWEIPGGCIEENESPFAGCMRELKEELGVDIPLKQILCIDYTVPEGERTESLQFLFTGPILSREEIENLSLDKNELKEWRFVTLKEAEELLGERLRERVAFCFPRIDEGRTFYLENGEPPIGIRDS